MIGYVKAHGTHSHRRGADARFPEIPALPQLAVPAGPKPGVSECLLAGMPGRLVTVSTARSACFLPLPWHEYESEIAKILSLT